LTFTNPNNECLFYFDIYFNFDKQDSIDDNFSINLLESA
jgi:hypothetical protein